MPSQKDPQEESKTLTNELQSPNQPHVWVFAETSAGEAPPAKAGGLSGKLGFNPAPKANKSAHHSSPDANRGLSGAWGGPPISKIMPPSEAETPKPSPKPRWPKLIFALVALLLITSLSLGAAILLAQSSQTQFISPLPDNPLVLAAQTPPLAQSKEVIGFLPYWNLNQEENFRYHLLTQVAFFGLEIDASGNIRKTRDDNLEEPGWTAYKSQAFGTVYRKAKQSGAKVILTLLAMDPDVLTTVVNNRLLRARAIQQTLEIIELKNLDGVNIDFELAGTPEPITSKNFTLFIEEFFVALKTKNPDLTLSVDVFADAVSKVRIWDIPALADHVDYIIIMGYDFHRAPSVRSGPVAPLRGSPSYWEYDITTALSDFSKAAPLDKLILGVPYYGYGWRTSSQNPYAPTYPNSGELATFKRVQSLIAEKDPELSWDELALAPRLMYLENEEIHQIYYENEISLGLKYDLVNEGGLAGVALWAIGYDGQYPNLWNLLAEKFPTQ